MDKDKIEQMLKAVMSDRLVSHLMNKIYHYEVEGVVNPSEYKYKYPRDTQSIFIFLMSPDISHGFGVPDDTIFAVRHGKSGHLYNFTKRFQVWNNCVMDSHKMIVLRPKA